LTALTPLALTAAALGPVARLTSWLLGALRRGLLTLLVLRCGSGLSFLGAPSLPLSLALLSTLLRFLTKRL
jgi:hypothetical protein